MPRLLLWLMPMLAALLLALSARAAPTGTWTASYPEGPVWIAGTLYWAEMGADRVMAWPGHGRPRVFFHAKGCGPTAIARYRAAEILILCHRAGSLVRTDAEGRALGTILRDDAGRPLRDPNDASADGRGGVWFTDPGLFRADAPAEGAVYYLAPDGRLTRRIAGLAYGNGVVVDRAQARLIVSEHMARRVLAWPLDDGKLGKGRTLFDFAAAGITPPAYAEAGPDGLAIAPDGTLWVAEYGAGRLHAWRDGKGLVATVRVPEKFITNIAFGPDGMAAITGSTINDRPPFPGKLRLLPIDRLTAPAPFQP